MIARRVVRLAAGTGVRAGLQRTQLAGHVSRLAGVRALSGYKVSGEDWTGRVDNPQRSSSEDLIDKVPVIEVDGTLAVCDGGGGSLGHPLEYIQLNDDAPTEPKVCLYCGLRFVMKGAH